MKKEKFLMQQSDMHQSMITNKGALNRMKNSEFVVEKICSQVRDAFDSKKPLIILDTDEIELATRVAGCCGVVDLKCKSNTQNLRTEFYYDKYIKAEEKNLMACENFSTDANALAELVKHANADEPGDNKIDAKLVLLHITPFKNDYKADPELINLLRKYVQSYIGFDDYSPIRSSCVILYGDIALLPKDLRGYVENIVPDYPSVKEIKETIFKINQKYGDKKHQPAPEDMISLAKELRGFTLVQTEFFTQKMLRLKQKNGAPLLCNLKECKKQVLESKIQNLMRFGGLLTLYRDKNNNDDELNSSNKADNIGGMTAFISKAKEIKLSMDEYHYSRRGQEPPKGVLLVGVSGCGKSEASRLLYRELGIPMLKLDMGSLMQGLVGASERNLRLALEQCEAMAPDVLYIDEIDKGISGTDSSSGDGGTFKRMIAYFLNWLQEKKTTCFIIATANDISCLPRELFRNDRFDIRFGVFLPTHDEIKSIFAEQMERAERKREDDAKEKGEELTHKLFADNCFEGNRNSDKPTVPDSIVKILTHKNATLRNPEEIKFVTGADIKTIIKNALSRLDDAAFNKPLDSIEWHNALRKVIEDKTTQTLGSSQADLNAIAACYVRLLRKGFVPVNDYVLFSEKDYVVDRDDKGNLLGAGIFADKSAAIQNDYDKELYKVLRRKINEMAFTIEEIEHKKECE